MSSSLVALAVGLALTAAVVVVGLRRNLSETTREGLPEFGGDPEGTTPKLDLYEGQERPRGPLSRRQQIWLSTIYLLLALLQLVDVVRSADDRLLHLGFALFFVLGFVLVVLRKHPAEAGFFRSGSRKSGAEPN
ncbi:MAG TPA: hypothetical protein VFB52_07225 [Solirubrobacterales bacterium]|nr:hypothetical protein [Solirubrobacterales bacterium]